MNGSGFVLWWLRQAESSLIHTLCPDQGKNHQQPVSLEVASPGHWPKPCSTSQK